MSLDSFLGGRTAAVKPTAETVEPPDRTVTEGNHRATELEGFDSPNAGADSGHVATPVPSATVISDTTPSGIVVEYQAAPRRFYRVNGVEVPSVTSVLDVLAKGGLTIWGMRVGIKGVVSLFEQGLLGTAYDWDADLERLAHADGNGYATAETIEALMKEHKLTTNHVKDSAADRGVIVHDSLEQWAKTSQLPNPDDYEENERGYVKGIVEFIKDSDPTPVRMETMVGSVAHGFAGRYDIELEFKSVRRVRLTPKQKWHDIEPSVVLADCKSSKGVYPLSHFRQLAAYECARVECGYPPTDAQYVLNVNGEGSYAFVRSTATIEDFLPVLDTWRSNQGL